MSTNPIKKPPHLEKLNITKLNWQQLTQLKQQIEQELVVFHDSLQTLKIAQNKFQVSGISLDKITPANQGKEVMVPLTDSIYVAGKLSNTDKVLVDIGTGYFAEKDVEDAKDYFKRRVAYVTEQMKKIEVLGYEKCEIRDATKAVMELKLKEQMAAQKELAERA